MTHSLPEIPELFNLTDYFLFRQSDGRFHDKAALRFGSLAYSYGEVARRTRAFAGLLRSADVRRGERVLIALPDSPPFVWAFFGAIANGCVAAMINPLTPSLQLSHLVEYTRCTALVTTPEVALSLRSLFETSSRIELRHIFLTRHLATGDDCDTPTGPIDMARCVDLASGMASTEALYRPCATHRDEPAVWLFTSGSTGQPKANIHAHRDFAFNAEAYAKRTVGYRESDVTVSVPRLFFGYATGTNLLFPFSVGATACLFSERPTVDSLANAIDMYRPTIVTNVPTTIGKFLDRDDELRAAGQFFDLSAVRFSLSAGEALPQTLLERWTSRFHSPIFDGIGSAEMFHIYVTNRPADVRPGSLGRAVVGYELRVLPENAIGTGSPQCAPGEIGVLWVRGDSMSHGYWLDREKSRAMFHGAWCRTGDLFLVDHDGYFYFAGRADELLKVSGQWLSPIEVENCLMTHDLVSGAAVIGIEEDGLLRTKAFVVLRSGTEASVTELQEHVRTNLAHFKVPKTIDFVRELPRNDRGKLDRKALRRSELVAEQVPTET